ncbi:M56 family metallopeptidase [Ruminococcus turbiniformis]|uniref:M56 family metallopeptidase n=1 Tax=Ruminococcus turbiniformis TaxID=2881258 RepID=UPI0022352D80|nr:M56 family metallopeptidase [Ruminococcus turbiniformis]
MELLREIFITILNMSVAAGIVILVILLLRLLFRKTPRKYLYALWLAAAFRLVCPWSVESGISLFNMEVFEPVQTEGNAQVWLVPEQMLEQQDQPEEEQAQAAQEGQPEETQAQAAQEDQTGEAQVQAAQEGQPEEEQTQAARQDQAEAASGTGFPASPLDILALVWIAGTVAFLGYEMVCWLRIRRLTFQAVRFEDDVYECDAIPSPFVMGIFRPVLYLPFGLSDEERTMILLHERCHIRRKDHIVKFVSMLLLAVYWFHPLVWAAFRFMSADMEMSCDDCVMERMGTGSKEEYSRCLLGLAVNRQPSAGILAFGESAVKARVKNILRFRKRSGFVRRTTAVCGIVLLAVLVTNGTGPGSGLSYGGYVRSGSLENPTEQLSAGIDYRMDRRSESAAFYCELWVDGELAGYRLIDVFEIGDGENRLPAEGTFVLERTLDLEDTARWAMDTRLSVAGFPAGVSRTIGSVSLSGSEPGGFMEDFCVEERAEKRALSHEDDIVLAAFHLARDYPDGTASVYGVSAEELSDRNSGAYWQNDLQRTNGGELIWRMAVSERTAEELEAAYAVPPAVKIMQEAATPYIGDNAADMDALNAVYVQELGAFELILQTESEPYGLTLAFQEECADPDAWNQKMQTKAVLLLALIDNAEQIRWTYPKETENGEIQTAIGMMDLETAQEITGTEDIKSCADDAQMLADLWMCAAGTKLFDRYTAGAL